MSVHAIYENNSLIVDFVLTNPKKDPIYVNDATVQLTIEDKFGEPIEGTVWPVTMDYVLGSNGLYSVSLIEVPGIEAEQPYSVVITVDGADGLQGEFRTEAEGSVKDV